MMSKLRSEVLRQGKKADDQVEVYREADPERAAAAGSRLDFPRFRGRVSTLIL